MSTSTGVDASKIKDSSVRNAWEHADRENGRLTVKGFNQLIKAAKDKEKGTKKGQRITEREKEDLKYILEKSAKTDALKEKLNKLRKKKAKGKLQPIKGAKKKQVLEVLRNADLLKPVRFTLDSLHYNPLRYKDIAGLIDKGRIHLFHRSYEDNELFQSKAHGTYYSRDDRLVLTISEGREEYMIDSTAVHEATHSIQDLNDVNLKVTRAEAAAHLAQAAYILARFKGKTDKLYSRLAQMKDAALALYKGETLQTAHIDQVLQAVTPAYKDVEAKAKGGNYNFEDDDSDVIEFLYRVFGTESEW